MGSFESSEKSLFRLLKRWRLRSVESVKISDAGIASLRSLSISIGQAWVDRFG
ncbi:hypothetical protein PN499_15825 [Kamptonema animale CS-326]|uniref:hypothetical protein n=1 Tax=Kamptonema animale TaxID=92934 RepID=UPI002330C659|nr:hypothetical protein [Kamptonema animale]MDB9512657.1 hypothetical protein [Kamptonema animale CS-326]